MRTEAAEDDVQFRRRNRRTRWIAALFEGGAAAIFTAILLSNDGRLAGIASGIAFGAVALVAFLLWPMTFKHREFPLWRLSTFGVLVIFFGVYLWLFIVQLSLLSWPDAPPLQHLWDRYSEPGQLLRLFMDTLAGSMVGVIVLGIFAIPAAIGIARLAVILGNPRLDPK